MLHTVSEVKKWHRGIEVIGGRLYIDGSPHSDCGVCGQIIKQFTEGNGTVKVVGGKSTKELKPYIVSVGYWLRSEEHSILNGELITTPKAKPIIRQVPSCFNCWNIQQQQKAKAGQGALVMYDVRGKK